MAIENVGKSIPKMRTLHLGDTVFLKPQFFEAVGLAIIRRGQ
jgi:hypothetical protein